MKVLLTGGAGYIGSHTAVALDAAGHAPVLYDNFCNSRRSVGERLSRILGHGVPLVEGDVRDVPRLTAVLREHGIAAVIHFAGLKAVGESVEKPLEYFDDNVGGTIALLRAMRGAGVGILVFSSSATVYGAPQYLPLDEAHPTSATNPYGRTKLQIEEILSEVARADAALRVARLRYFNPVGAHDSGLIGEEPNGIPNNLMPYIAEVAAGLRPHLNVFGDDYPTPDGTGVRDYLHVMDLAEGHVAALAYLAAHPPGDFVCNLGTGRGTSVLELAAAFAAATGIAIPHRIAPRRPGDVPACYAKVDKARQELGWTARRTLSEMCESAWRFQRNRRKPAD